MKSSALALKRQISYISQKSSFFRDRFLKWFLFSFAAGAAIGLIIAGIHVLIYDVLWRQSIRLSMSNWWISILPLLAILLSSFLINRFSRNPSDYGTEEVIKAFHEEGGLIDAKSAPAKILSAVLTIGLGGSAGLEGPSIHTGAVIGSWLQKKLSRFGFEEEDRRWMMLAGAAAGISAIFKAPLTGIIFALEVPYRDDLAHRAFLPSLIASVTSYFFFVSIVGIKPLFVVPHLFALNYKMLVYATALGVICGFAARLFVIFFKWSASLLSSKFEFPYLRALVGGGIVSASGAISLMLFGAPLSLGTGYEVIKLALQAKMASSSLIALFVLKAIATSATLNAGGVGGTFIPLIFLGAISGSAFGKVIGSASTVYPIIGMAGFLAAGYNVPLAAAAFVAETTGSPGFVMPGLLAAAISYAASGRVGLSSYQRYGREMVILRTLGSTVSKSMTRPVIVVPASTPISDFVRDYLVKYRHKSFPVERDGKLFGMVGITDIRGVPEDRWDEVAVGEVASAQVATVFPDEELSVALNAMERGDFDRLPVVSREDPNRIAGIIALTDIVRLEELSEFFHP